MAEGSDWHLATDFFPDAGDEMRSTTASLARAHTHLSCLLRGWEREGGLCPSLSINCRLGAVRMHFIYYLIRAPGQFCEIVLPLF